jgi:flagellar protein FlgJ
MDINIMGMDLIGVGSNAMDLYVSQTQRNEAELKGFQTVFEKALERKTAEDDRELREACESFESYFLQIMLREMRKTTFDDNGFLPKSSAEKMFTDMLDEEIAKSASKGKGIGLADQLYRQMTMYDAPRTEQL